MPFHFQLNTVTPLILNQLLYTVLSLTQSPSASDLTSWWCLIIIIIIVIIIITLLAKTTRQSNKYLRPSFISQPSISVDRELLRYLPGHADAFQTVLYRGLSSSFVVFQAFNLNRLCPSVQLVLGVCCRPFAERARTISVFSLLWWDSPVSRPGPSSLYQM